MNIYRKAFWAATLERMLRGAAIGALLYLGSQAGQAIETGRLNAFDLHWTIVGYFLGGALISLLMSLAGNAGSGNGPAFNSTEVVSPPAVVPAGPTPKIYPDDADESDYREGGLGLPNNLKRPPGE